MAAKLTAIKLKNNKLKRMMLDSDHLQKKWISAVKRNAAEHNIPFDKIDWEQEDKNYKKYINDNFKS